MKVSMRSMALFALVAVGVLAMACGRPAEPPVPAPRAPEPPPTPEVHTAAATAWRESHEANYRYEWVPISGLYTLSPGVHAIGSAADNALVVEGLPPVAGQVVVAGDVVRFEPADGVDVVRKGARTRPQPGQPPDARVTGPIVLTATGQASAPEIAIGDVRLVIHTGGGRLALRVRDPNSAQAQSFVGFAWFPIDLTYRVVGRFIADAEPRQLQVINTSNDLDTYATEGVVEFTLGGETLRLRPFTTRPNRFYFVFRDDSSGEETYATARFLYSDLLSDGTTVLDFNEAYNPPCAFNPYTTCPIPLRENVLPVKILAGERVNPIEEQRTGGR
ncbi:MAG TPA: DUF1684 domain-containing protein [Vicinamibacterales bacterium]|nr:DUF1684 domain-containing protein [Vicinamibacterales bacterium]